LVGLRPVQQPGLERTGLQLAGTLNASEEYEHLGTVEICALNLHQRYEALMSQRHIEVQEQEAFAAVSEVIRATPPVLWSWLNDPRTPLLLFRTRGLEFVPVSRPNGRTGRRRDDALRARKEHGDARNRAGLEAVRLLHG